MVRLWSLTTHGELSCVRMGEQLTSMSFRTYDKKVTTQLPVSKVIFVEDCPLFDLGLRIEFFCVGRLLVVSVFGSHW